MKLKNILSEVDDNKIIKYTDADGQSAEMKAGSAKTMPDDHPAKVAYNKEKKASDKFSTDKAKKGATDVSFTRKDDKVSSGGRGLTAQRGLEDIVRGNTTKIEGIPLSKDLADGIQTWIKMSPYGKKYGKFINKGKFASLIRPANAFGVDRYLTPKAKKEFKTIVKSMRESVSSKLTDIVKEEKLNEFDRRMVSLVNNSDKVKLADALQGYVYELADDGYDERDIGKYVLKLVADYIKSYYRQATR